MTKAPEEGQIWEWRAFGRVSDDLKARVQAYPIRMGIQDRVEDDLYFISAHSDQNVKLRKSGDEWTLKFKFLLAQGARSIELYRESLSTIYRFPVEAIRLQEAAKLLDVTLPESARLSGVYDKESFVKTLAACTPSVSTVRVSKMRSQFQYDGGWMELAYITFPGAHTESLSIQSPDIRVVEEMLDAMQPGPELEVMNYIEACRRWS